MTPKPVIEKSLLRMKLEKAQLRLPYLPLSVADSVRPRLETAHHALDRAVELWHEADAKRRELVERGRAASAELVRSWKESRRQSRASFAAARREWREAARMLSSLPEEA